MGCGRDNLSVEECVYVCQSVCHHVRTRIISVLRVVRARSVRHQTVKILGRGELKPGWKHILGVKGT